MTADSFNHRLAQERARLERAKQKLAKQQARMKRLEQQRLLAFAETVGLEACDCFYQLDEATRQAYAGKIRVVLLQATAKRATPAEPVPGSSASQCQ